VTTAAGVLRAARSQLGVTEKPVNRVMYNDWASVPPGPWCAAFVSWALDRAGALDIPKFVYCPTGMNAYKADGRWGRSPRIGAVAFYQWPGMGRVAHVGLVEALRSDGSIVAIEGNTDVAGGRTGGKVMRQVRRANIAGYGYPKYDALEESMIVKPDYDPPLPVTAWMEYWAGPGAYGLAPDGGIYRFGNNLPDFGSMAEASRRKDFVGRVAAQLTRRDDGVEGLMITATSGEKYRLP
jgi:CHAP domain